MPSKRKKRTWVEGPSPLFPHLRRLLRTLRENHNLTRAELAAKTGISEQTIGRIEKGPRKITTQELDVLLPVLGIRDLVQLQRRLSWFRLATESGIFVTGPMEVGEGVIDLDVKPGGAGVHVLRLHLGEQRVLLNLTFERPLTEGDLAQAELLL